jgi:CelD/BcsL family acetyltransferase involved in cellulose biosynthesis
VETLGDWETYKATWSRKHRQKMAWAMRQLARQGNVRLELLSHLPPPDVGRHLRRGWEIEDRSWKGTLGTSVLHTPGMEEFYCRQAELLAEREQLELAFLRCGDQTPAFCFGQTAKGVFHSVKTAYDPSFADFSPGQVLRYLLLEHFFHQPDRAAFDFLGPVTPAHAVWRPALYTIARWAVAPRGGLGKWALRGYELWRTDSSTPPQIVPSAAVPQ